MVAGQDVGTVVDPAAAEAAGGSKAAATASSARDMAVRARTASRQLQVRAEAEEREGPCGCRVSRGTVVREQQLWRAGL